MRILPKVSEKNFVEEKKRLQKKKTPKQIGGQIFNSVTLATRVRCEIMWAMSAQYKTAEEDMYVSTFQTRPRLHIRQTDGEKKLYSLTYSDAILKYGRDLEIEILWEAYRKAGSSFKGTLS